MNAPTASLEAMIAWRDQLAAKIAAGADARDVVALSRALVKAQDAIDAKQSASEHSRPACRIGIPGLDTDLDTVSNQDPLRVTFSLDLYPATLVAIQCVLDAFEQGLDVRIITQPDLVAAVDQLLHGSPSVGASGPESRDAVEPIVGAAPGADSSGAPGATPKGVAS